MHSNTSILLATFLLVLAVVVRTGEADTFDYNRFTLFVDQLEKDASDLATEVERLYKRRCNETTMNECRNANYGECHKYLPDQQCLDSPNYNHTVCSSGNSDYGGLWSFSVSNIRFPRALANGVQGNPTDRSLIESICFSRYLDEWLIKKWEAGKPFYKKLGVDPRAMYFGSDSGLFRMYPSTQSAVCGQFDPRTRPWYVSASSGPKNVVLILDISGSMDSVNRLNDLKDAAKRIVETLTASDSVLIVPFSSTAEPITDNGYVFKATSKNKEKLIEEINQLSADGSMNFYDVFLKAFVTLDASVEKESTTDCNTAVIFLTDGVNNSDGPGLEEVSNLVSTRIKSLSDKLKKPVLLFTYSVSESSDDAVHLYPKQLACSVELGVWSKITNRDDIVDALSNYYRLFAVGLGPDNNQDFVAWVEPYQFVIGGTWGTTFSVPVFDRTKTPNLILGVDVTMEALDAALATKDNTSAVPGSKRAEDLREESIKRIVEKSKAKCPQLNVLPCQMEAYRALSAPDNEGLCGFNCSGVEITQVQAEKCPNLSDSDYPKTLYAEPREKLLSYEERVCCTASEDKPPVGLIVGAVVGGVAGICIGLSLFLHFKKCSKRRDGNQGETIPVNTNNTSPTNPVWSANPTLNFAPTNPVWSANPVPAVKFANAPRVPASEPSEASEHSEYISCSEAGDTGSVSS